MKGDRIQADHGEAHVRYLSELLLLLWRTPLYGVGAVNPKVLRYPARGDTADKWQSKG